MSIAPNDWVKVQQRTFTKWLNNHLRKKGLAQIDELETAFSDGIALMHVVHALYEVPLPKHNKTPKLRPHKLDNVNLALKMLEEAEVKTNFLNQTHLLDNDLKMILGMVWAIILDYAIKGISVEEMTAKEGLLLWVRKKTANYNHVDPPGVKNFTTSWKSGMALCALIHRHRPNLIDYDSLEPANSRDNLELAFSVAEEHLDIPRLLEVEDLEAVRPDERSVMTYISEFFHRFAGEDMKETAARRVKNLLEFIGDMQQRQAAFEERARTFISWCNSETERLANHDLGSTLEEADSAFNAFREFLTGPKPEHAVEKLDVESLYANIQGELAVNDRYGYEAPADCNIDAIGAAWDALNAAEAAHGRAVRDFRFSFIEKHEASVPQEKIDEFNEAFNHFDKDDSNTLTRIEFKAALSALGVPFADDEAFERVFTSVSDGEEFISREQYIRYNTKLNEDKDSPDQLLESFRTITDQQDVVTAEQLAVPPLTDEDVEYLKAAIPETEPGVYDYKTFIANNFTSYNGE